MRSSHHVQSNCTWRDNHQLLGFVELSARVTNNNVKYVMCNDKNNDKLSCLLASHGNAATTPKRSLQRCLPCLLPLLLRSVGLRGWGGDDNNDVNRRGDDDDDTTISLKRARGMVFGVAAITMTTISTATPPTADCGTMTADDGSNRRAGGGV